MSRQDWTRLDEPDWPYMFAWNLTLGAALCLAYAVAIFNGINGAWWPGCRRSAWAPRGHGERQ